MLKIADLNESMRENFKEVFGDKGENVIKAAQKCIDEGKSYTEIRWCIEQAVRILPIDQQKRALDILIPFIVVG